MFSFNDNMNGKINIGGDPADTAYRYKRDMIIIEKAGRNMFKISNISIICKQLKVGDEFMKKFYDGVKARGHHIYKEGHFRGGITVKELEKIMVDLTLKYLLCPTCKLPEWNGRSCRACGAAKVRRGAAAVEEKEDPDEPTCPHLELATMYMKKLYTLRLNTPADSPRRAVIDRAQDAFWALPLCVERAVTPAKCKEKYALWVENVVKFFFPDE